MEKVVRRDLEGRLGRRYSLGHENWSVHLCLLDGFLFVLIILILPLQVLNQFTSQPKLKTESTTP